MNRNRKELISMPTTRTHNRGVIATLALCLFVSACGQNRVTERAANNSNPGIQSISSGSSGTITSGTVWMSGGGWMSGNGSGGGIWTVCNGQGFCGSSDLETRPNDDKGPTLLNVRQSAKQIPTASLPPATYIKLAKRAGIEGAGIDQAKMTEFVHEHGLTVYDFSTVDNYLYRQALKQGARVRWVWKPMRPTDAKQIAEVAAPSERVGVVRSAAVYDKPIPARVLDEIGCLLEDSGKPDLVFLVSDYEVVRPDPFLAISTPSLLKAGYIWIIDQWDEPGFVDKLPVATASVR